MITLLLPIRTESEANSREHWAKKMKRAQEQRWIVKAGIGGKRWELSRMMSLHAGGYIVTLTRIGQRKLDDDNLARSFKAIRDQIADQMGINDGSDLFVWRYAQEKGKPKEYAVRIEIEEG
jgi:hypothetical protein